MVRNNNFPEAGPSTKENPTTEHENVSITTPPAVDPLQQCLRTTIENMGPETPNFNSTVTETEDSLIATLPQSQSHQSGANCNMEFAELYMIADGSFVSNSSNLEFESTEASLMTNIPLSLAEYNGNKECPDAYARTSPMAARQSGTYVKPCCQCSGEIVDLLAKAKRKQGIQRVSRLDGPKFCRWFRNKSKKRNQPLTEYYQMDMIQPEDEHSPPRRVIFNLIEEFPKPQSTTKGTNTWHVVHDVTMQAASKDFNGRQVMQQDDPTQCKTMKDRSNERARAMSAVEDSVKGFKTIYKKNENIEEKIKRCDCNVSTRVDVYYFDHGNAAYLRTTDNVPLIRAEIIADQTEDYTTKFWGEIFGTVHIGVSFITSFFLQFVSGFSDLFYKRL